MKKNADAPEEKNDAIDAGEPAGAPSGSRSTCTPTRAEIDVEATSAAKRVFAALGGGGVPLILVANKAMRGFDEAKLTALLKDSR